MKWCLFIFDPKKIVLQETFPDEFLKLQDRLLPFLDVKDVVIEDSVGDNYGGLINSYISHTYRQYDHVCLVYDGKNWADGIANHSFYTLSFNKEHINHLTANLIDEYLATEYKEGNGLALVAESLYKLYIRMATSVSYPSDGCTLEEKRALIEQLKQYF